MSSARQQQGFMIHGDKIVASPTHGGLIPTHGGLNPKHGDPNLDTGPAALTAPTISGVVGGTLTKTAGTYSGSPTITHQWQKKIASAYIDIVGQTGATLASVYATHGNNIRCKETATDGTGSTTQYTLPALYLGLVSNGWRQTHIAGSTNPAFSWTLAYAFDDIPDGSLRIVHANWYWDLFPTKTELGSGGTLTGTGSIRYGGVNYQAKYSGATSGTCADGANLISDPINTSGVTITKGTWYQVRTFDNFSSGSMLYISGATYGSNTFDPTNYTANLSGNGSMGGEGMIYISATDQTMANTGTFTPTVTGNNGPIRRPLALIAPTRIVSLGSVGGDSIFQGQFDKFDNDNALGFQRICNAAGYPCLDLSGQGETVVNQKSNFVKRGATAQWFSAALQQSGVNDFTAAVGNASAATVEANLTGVGGLVTTYCANTPTYAVTIIPPVTSTDNYATSGANMTADSNSPARVTFNTDMRGVPAGYAGCLDFAAILENSLNSGKRLTTGSAFGYQLDTVHPNRAAYILSKPLLTSATITR